VNRVVPDDKVIEEAETVAKKLASLSQRTVRQNKVLVNRAFELGGFRQALAYRDDPAVRAVAEQTSADDEHIRVLREKGWEAFRESRDRLYRE
jgi:enoyl-CoA hydratase/carnithine racemase